MKTLALLALVLASACSSGGADIGAQTDAGGGQSDSATGCSVALQLPTQNPRVGVDAAIRATASVLGVSGVVAYGWTATLDGAPTDFAVSAPDGSSIDIPVTTAGTVHVQLVLSDHPECLGAQGDVTVLPTTLATATYRLRVTPPAAAQVPASDALVQVHGGVDTVVPVALATGFPFSGGQVVDGTGAGVAAYVRMTPVGAPASVVEAYSTSLGALPTLHVLGQAHAALIVPSDPALAPAVLAWQPGGTSTFTVTGGTTVAGVIKDPAGAALVGATVALRVGGTPSSLGTTGAGGAFALHATPQAGATIDIVVTPPASSGLPRLVASSSAIALTAPWTIAYAPGLATRAIGGVHVQRGGAAVVGAQVDLRGAVAAAGTIADGTTTVPAAGDVRLTLTTDATGALSGRAPAAPLSLVLTRTPTDVALAALDLTSGAPAVVATSAPVTVTGTITSATGPLDHARVEATGTGALAGVSVSATSDGSGAFALPLAAGGGFALHVSDPAGRASALDATITSATASALGSLALPSAVHLTGTITVSGATTSLAGTAVQLMCAACTGASAQVPIAETAADANGRFRLAVPDPSAAR